MTTGDEEAHLAQLPPSMMEKLYPVELPPYVSFANFMQRAYETAVACDSEFSFHFASAKALVAIDPKASEYMEEVLTSGFPGMLGFALEHVPTNDLAPSTPTVELLEILSLSRIIQAISKVKSLRSNFGELEAEAFYSVGQIALAVNRNAPLLFLKEVKSVFDV